MKTVEEREQIRRAYYVEGKSMRQIAIDLHHSYWTIRSAVSDARVQPYSLRVAKRAPVLGPYKAQVAAGAGHATGIDLASVPACPTPDPHRR